MSEKNVADSTTKLTDIVVAMPIDTPNPVFVHGADGSILGSAVLEFVKGGLQARFILDPHNPAAFDLANEPSRCTFVLDADITNGCMRNIYIRLDSK